MVAYLHPGVFIEEIPAGVKPVEMVSTSIAVFVGEARRGPILAPTLVHSFDQYRSAFGPIASASDAMGIAAQSFYLNGGKDAYIVRVAGGTLTTAGIIL